MRVFTSTTTNLPYFLIEKKKKNFAFFIFSFGIFFVSCNDDQIWCEEISACVYQVEDCPGDIDCSDGSNSELCEGKLVIPDLSPDLSPDLGPGRSLYVRL